ncbi:CaiB/BaiF CoA transferase family protein [Streptomyces gobiensis]|uniref:CaiB/BaiF CoA transferase family protein n=1 Tax=Streptomyces gobiensis TaxID=2875706 RepID=UPI001E3DE6A7|nr:CaiB/BaiF CoA-transferase family protein [Streptomyces gobiensis]UGY94151.1 CoA transferase [Streptomyces gobiensis]
MARPGPLAGVRVVELAAHGPTPFCGMLLADLGADVVRVVHPKPPSADWDLPTDGQAVLDRGKRSLPVDLKDPDGAALVLALAGRTDVFLEGFRPGVAERLGIGPDRCLARNPRLVYGRMTGWGQTGPLAQTAGHDITYLAVTGVLDAIGRADGPPQIPLNLLGDFGGGAMYLAVGVLAALSQVARTGRGQTVDAAIVDGVSHLSTMVFGMLAAGEWSGQRGGNLLDSGCPFYNVYPTADGRHMAVGALEPKFYREFVRLLGVWEMVPGHREPSVWDELYRIFAGVFRTRTQREWCEVFDGTEACVSPVLSLTEARHHPQLAARHTLTEIGGVPQPAPAPRFSATPTAVPPPAETGTDRSEEILAEWGVRRSGSRDA